MFGRTAFAALLATLALAPSHAQVRPQADPYRWCAHYSGDGGNGTNCYFLTLEQCRWAISGVGGSCRPNPFFTGGAEPPARRR